MHGSQMSCRASFGELVSLIASRVRTGSGIILDAHYARRHRPIEQPHFDNGRDEQGVPKVVLNPKDD
jgi:hypothetical protein